MSLRTWWATHRPQIFTSQTLSERDHELIQKALLEHNKWQSLEEGKRELNSLLGGEQSHSPYGVSIFEEIASGYNENSEGQQTQISKGGSTQVVSESTDFVGSGLNIGANPETAQTLGSLRLAQRASHDQWAKMPPAKAIIENLKRYVIGRGIKYDIPAPKVEEYIRRWWIQNDMEKRYKDGFRDLCLDGEIIWSFFDVDTKDTDFDPQYDTPVVVRRIPSEQVEDLEVDPNDYETTLAYKRVYQRLVNGEMREEAKFYLDISHPVGDEKKFKLPTTLNKTHSQNEQKAEKGVRAQMFTLGLTFDERGRVAMDSVLRWNRILVDFVYDRGRLNHLRTKIFLIETRATKSGIQTSSNYERMPKGGIKLVATGNTQYTLVSPNTGASDAEYDFKMISYMIASGMQMPYHVLIQDASNNNFASIKEAGNPWAHAVTDYQDEYAEMVRAQIRYVITQGIRSGQLPSEIEFKEYPGSNIGEIKRYIYKALLDGRPERQVVQEVLEAFGDGEKLLEPVTRKMRTVDVPIELVFPKVVHTDPDKMAAYMKIVRELGLVSKETATRELGYDPDVERARIEQEDEADFEKSRGRQAQLAQDMFGQQKDSGGDNGDNQNGSSQGGPIPPGKGDQKTKTKGEK